MIRPDAPTQAPCAPDDRPAGCASAHVYPLCGCGARPATTAPLPPPDGVAAALAAHATMLATADTYGRAVLALSPVERARLHRLIAGTGCTRCGRPTPEGRRCAHCAIGGR